MPLPLNPNCKCCQLAQAILDTTEGAEFSATMAALTNVLARKIHGEFILNAPAGPTVRAVVIQGSLNIIERQVSENLTALSTR